MTCFYISQTFKINELYGPSTNSKLSIRKNVIFTEKKHITNIYKAQETDVLQNTRKYPIVCSSINITFDTELWSELCASPG